MYRLAIVVVALITWIAAPPPAGAAQDGVIVYGTDYRVFRTGRGGWEQCEDACRADGRCQAWLFVRPTGQCRLKETVGPTLRNPCCVSDVRGRGPHGGRPDRGGTSVPRTITTLNYTSTVEGRGACIRTEPPVPGHFGGWACLWKDNDLYGEISDLILAAFQSGATCRIDWLAPWQSPGGPDDGARISSIECTRSAP